MAVAVVSRSNLSKCLISNQRGSIAIESAASASAVLAFFIIACCAIYVVFTQLTINHYGYQALICVAEGQPSLACKAAIKAKLASTLPFGGIKTFNLVSNRYRFFVDLKWRLSQPFVDRFDLRVISYTQTLRYPSGY